MNLRATYLEGELNKILQQFNIAYEYSEFSLLENDPRFLEIVKRLMEILKKSNYLRGLVKGSVFV